MPADLGALTQAFLSAHTIELVPIDRAKLADCLAVLLSSARAMWPTVRLDEGAFITRIAQAVPPIAARQDLEAAIATLHTSDLYLTTGCALGDPAALLLFERDFMVHVPRYLSRLKLSSSLVDEVQQMLREKLLVSAGGPPRIADYSGRGDLAGWLRVAAIRTAVSLQRQLEAKAERDGKPRVHAPVLPMPPELQLFRNKYQSEFERTF
jgi:RNA polymerase sigma-70 factor